MFSTSLIWACAASPALASLGETGYSDLGIARGFSAQEAFVPALPGNGALDRGVGAETGCPRVHPQPAEPSLSLGSSASGIPTVACLLVVLFALRCLPWIVTARPINPTLAWPVFPSLASLGAAGHVDFGILARGLAAASG